MDWFTEGRTFGKAIHQEVQERGAKRIEEISNEHGEDAMTAFVMGLVMASKEVE